MRAGKHDSIEKRNNITVLRQVEPRMDAGGCDSNDFKLLEKVKLSAAVACEDLPSGEIRANAAVCPPI